MSHLYYLATENHFNEGSPPSQREYVLSDFPLTSSPNSGSESSLFYRSISNAYTLNSSCFDDNHDDDDDIEDLV